MYKRQRYGFVEQHSTAYYAAAWIHGFGGEIISADGEPFPDAEAVQDALAYHKKFVGLMPGETEYATVNTLFLDVYKRQAQKRERRSTRGIRMDTCGLFMRFRMQRVERSRAWFV